MKAIILAGGKGERANDYGEEKPKCLFEFNGKTTLQHQLEALKENGIKDVVIVTGYKKEKVMEHVRGNPAFQNMNIEFVDNLDYAITKPSYGWWLARENVKDEDSVIHFNSDLIFFPELVRRLISDSRENLVVVDRGVELNDSMEQVILDKEGRILHMDKANIHGANGKGTGVAKFSRKAVEFLLNKLQDYIVYKNDRNQNFYGMVRLAVKELDFYGLDLEKSFFKEYNTAEDFDRAKSAYESLNEGKIRKALILAGGKADRLKHFTENKPVWLLEVNNKPIIEYQLEALKKNGITDLIVIVGYKGFMIREYIEKNENFKNFEVTYVENDEYSSTGTSYGWWLARNFIKDEEQVLHLHSDLVFDEKLLTELIENKNENVLCVDSKINLDDSMEQVILDVGTNQILYMDKRNIPGAHGKAVGVAKFSKEVVRAMIDKIEAHHKLGDKQQAFYGIIRKILHEKLFHYIDIEERIFREVNTDEDYQKTFFKKRAVEIGLPEKNSVIMLYGLPATGKTFASRKIRDYFERDMNVEVISTFKIREEKNLFDLESEEQREKVYDEICKVLDEKLSRKICKCIILDGNFNKKERRKKIYNIVKKHNCDFYIVECLVDDENEIRRRLEKRKPEIGMEQKANTAELHAMIKNSGQDLSVDEFSNPVPIIISYDSHLDEAKLSPKQYVVKGIIDALKNKREVAAEIIFVRHGETENNKEGILQGHLDVSLNENGLKDAEELAENLKEIKFENIFSSDLKRAVECAEKIGKNFPEVKIKKEPLLRERNFGEHQGRSLIELGYSNIDYDEMVRHLYECNCPFGETNKQLIERIKKFLKKVKTEGGKRTLAVTHGGVIMLLLNHLLGEEIKFENSRQHKNGYFSYVKLDDEMNIVDSLINVHVSEVSDYLNRH